MKRGLMERKKQHDIYHGDAFEIMPTLCDSSVDLVVTDPPYFMAPVSAVKKGSTVSNMQDKLNARFFYEKMFSDIYRLLNDSGKAFIFMNLASFHAASAALDHLGIEMRNLIVWDKDFPSLGGNTKKFRYSYELIMYFGKPDATVLNRSVRDIIRISGNPSRRKTKHPAEKPQALFERLIDISEIETGILLDPFLGSGTAIRAANAKGFKAIGIEAEQKFLEIAQQAV